MSELYKNKYRVESARLKGYDYSSPGAYFITICTKNRKHFFGAILNGDMILNTAGKIVWDCWKNLPHHYSNLIIDEFVVMPNHVHGIFIIKNVERCPVETGPVETGPVETGLRPVSTTTNIKTTNPKHGLSEFVRALKSFSARRINEWRKTNLPEIWQSRFYDHIIRDDELNRIREYILDNPANWLKDEHFIAM